MKWVPLSVRKPPWTRNRYWFTDGKESHLCGGNDEWIKECTHWLEFDLPPLPEKEMSKEDKLIKEIESSIYVEGLTLHSFLKSILEILKTKADK